MKHYQPTTDTYLRATCWLFTMNSGKVSSPYGAAAIAENIEVSARNKTMSDSCSTAVDAFSSPQGGKAEATCNHMLH